MMVTVQVLAIVAVLIPAFAMKSRKPDPARWERHHR